jgi:hypothetical protein
MKMTKTDKEKAATGPPVISARAQPVQPHRESGRGHQPAVDGWSAVDTGGAGRKLDRGPPPRARRERVGDTRAPMEVVSHGERRGSLAVSTRRAASSGSLTLGRGALKTFR